MSFLDNFTSSKQEITQHIMYTEDQLMARLKFFIGVCLSLTLTGTVFVVLYSLIFVTQPLNAISPIDQKFFELIVPIATFLTGTLSGIMLAGNDKEAQKMALQAANRPVSPSPMTPGSFGSSMPTPSPFVGASMPPSSFGSAMPAPMPQTSQFNSPVTPTFVPGIVMSSTGKPMPIQPPQPEL